ncbi:hypothetical protein DFJ74DRAFT_596754, partial [Hyaloraphidium curvatum]
DGIKIGAALIAELFGCGSSPPSPPPSPSGAQPSPGRADAMPPLDAFMARIIARTRIDPDTVCLALLYCRRLKDKHPQCRGSHGTGHRLFLAAILTACKVLHDDAYENAAWAKATAGLFSNAQVNEIEYEFLYYLDWQLHVAAE